MKESSLLIVGCGDLGEKVGRALQKLHWRIDAVRRRPPADSAGFTWHATDYSINGSLDFAETLQPDFVLATFTPTDREVAGYQRGFTRAAANLLHGIGSHQVKCLIMVSSTRVYAEKDGGWVDETSPLDRTDERAGAIIEAERLLLQSGQAACVVRCAGIYGASDGRLQARVKRGEIAPADPPRYTNRIHRDDCAGFLAHLLLRAQAGDRLHAIYNAVDNAPAPAHEVESWLAGAMGVTAPALAGRKHDSESGHKRCRNALLQSSGYRLRYPDYRAGYGAVLYPG